MSDHLDQAEIRNPEAREADLFARLPVVLTHAIADAPGWAKRLGDLEPRAISSRNALATLPVLRKTDLMEAQAADPPFGKFTTGERGTYPRVFLSPGPVWEPQATGSDPWNGARALFAAGFRKRDIVVNAFSYHLTPGGFIVDEGARALGCTVFPAGTGNTDLQVDAIAALGASGLCCTPDFVKVVLDRAEETGRTINSLQRALVSGGALFPQMRQEYDARGVAVTQAYGTADLGIIAYESEAREGLIVNEDLIVEIVRPGTDDPVPDGEVGEIVVTTFNRGYPLIRFGTGDLSAVMEGLSPCGRTNTRIKGWMGRADQRTKVKGMFVDPKQIAEIAKRHPEITRARLVVGRTNEQDTMTLRIETEQDIGPAVAESLAAVTKLKGAVQVVEPGSLPNDGVIIEDDRPAPVAGSAI